ncbi:lamin tail domain-containing protein [Haloferax sp. DFSO52]|uniref:lamin tail domain-containing protein n=1 Tax=Haloferax sp. DFSO52 TaxID=3388505 RepID=UPI003A88A519
MADDSSHTVWERLEPLTRNRELTGTLRAELADPLWLLTRQRQFGEFRGEDAGSPVEACIEYELDHLTRVKVGETTLEYDPSTDPPVETLVEREPVAAASETPTYKRRVEAGMNFLDRVCRAFDGRSWAITDFAAEYRLDEPGTVDDAARRYADVLDGMGDDGTRSARGLDGHAIYTELVGPTASQPATTVDWTRFESPVTTFLADESWDRATFEPVAEAFVQWYANLYAEPGPDEDAWNPDRLEYDATVSAGAGANETVFRATEYDGGRLDWHDFEVDAEGSLRETGDATTSPSPLERLPTKATFRGMPSSRLWELEDAAVNLAELSAAADDLSRLFLIEFALIAGDDWFTIPLEAPVGSVTRVTDLSVTDTFGMQTEDVPATVDQPDADNWSMFTFDLPNHTEPGLFLPSVVGTSLTGETVEDVLFARDEVANLVFGIESTAEGALGLPLDRDQFRLPSAAVADLHVAEEGLTGQAAADAEFVELSNPGDAPLSLAGWTLYAQHSAFADPASASNADTLDLSSVTLPPESTVRVVTGGDATLDTDEQRHLERATPILAPDRVVSLTRLLEDGTEGLVTVEPVDQNQLTEYPAYHLANEAPDNWFPYLPSVDAGVHRFELGLLLDRDALSGGVDAIPTPIGRILDPDAAIYDEEIPRGGVRITRSYESTTWLDGRTHVWSSRRVRPGTGEVSSGLRFDYLEESDGTEE